MCSLATIYTHIQLYIHIYIYRICSLVTFVNNHLSIMCKLDNKKGSAECNARKIKTRNTHLARTRPVFKPCERLALRVP